MSLSSVSWAAAVLLGRSFSLDLSEPELPCEGDMSYFGSWQAHGPASVVLVPWADMCQHSSDAGTLIHTLICMCACGWVGGGGV